MGFSTFDERSLISAPTQLSQYSGIVAVPIFLAVEGPVRFDLIALNSTCAASHVVELLLAAPTVPVIIGSVTVPAGAGADGSPPVSLLANILTGPQDGLVFQRNQTLYVRAQVILGAGELINILYLGGYV
jgi:hypothetical protein